MKNEALVKEINKNMSLLLPTGTSIEDLTIALAAKINDLIQNDFQYLISVLYRIDVSEAKLKQLLQQQPQQNAGTIIATLMIDRQLEKIKTRQQFSARDNHFDEEEKW